MNSSTSDLRQTISGLLAAFSDALSTMDDREFELLIQGKAKLRLKEEPRSKRLRVEDIDYRAILADVAQKLNGAESREAAGAMLASVDMPRKKEFLLRLAREFHVPVATKDSIDSIERQLIENVVAAKLASQAIQKVVL